MYLEQRLELTFAQFVVMEVLLKVPRVVTIMKGWVEVGAKSELVEA